MLIFVIIKKYCMILKENEIIFILLGLNVCEIMGIVISGVIVLINWYSF